MFALHLDALGGAAGDMFAASLLSLRPALFDGVRTAVERAAGVSCRLVAHHDGVLAGSRFLVDDPERDAHDHVTWRLIRTQLAGAGLAPPVARRAHAIFALLADAEARVHGVEPDEVTFHEVGARDSLADIVASAFLLDALAVERATVSALPLGGGRVDTAHGPMPVPAPATALLLAGFDWVDDGIGGERVTPTGAAILRHLAGGATGDAGEAATADVDAGNGGAVRAPGSLRGTGIGFGQRRLNGISNCLRVLLFDQPRADGRATADAVAAGRDTVAVLTCEIDDQTAEDLATGIDRLRALPAVRDALTMAVFGKNGRLATRLQILADASAADDVADAVFRETTTIGLRLALTERRVLARRAMLSANGVRVKLASRPGGDTGKAEAADLATRGDAAERERARRAALGGAMPARDACGERS